MSITPLEIEVSGELSGPALRREPVRVRDLTDALAELWWRAGPRRGRPELSLDTLGISLLPIPADSRGESGASSCAGFALLAEGAGGAPVRCAFAREGLAHVARRAARALVAEGRLGADAVAHWCLCAAGGNGPAPIAAEDVPVPPSIELAVHPLAPLLERSRELDPPTEAGLHPVFYTESAREAAERLARQGALERPPVETGCVLVGPLVACPESGEVFPVVLDVLEATDASRTEFSLDFTGATWMRIQAVLRARRAQESTRAHRLLGQAHGHNFLPDGGAAPCAECARLPVCTRSSAFLSADDLEWCRAVFSGEPWQLSHVFGLDARGRSVEAFYGQHRGRLARRGYRVIPEFPSFA